MIVSSHKPLQATIFIQAWWSQTSHTNTFSFGILKIFLSWLQRVKMSSCLPLCLQLCLPLCLQREGCFWKIFFQFMSWLPGRTPSLISNFTKPVHPNIYPNISPNILALILLALILALMCSRSTSIQNSDDSLMWYFWAGCLVPKHSLQFHSTRSALILALIELLSLIEWNVVVYMVFSNHSSFTHHSSNFGFFRSESGVSSSDLSTFSCTYGRKAIFG